MWLEHPLPIIYAFLIVSLKLKVYAMFVNVDTRMTNFSFYWNFPYSYQFQYTQAYCAFLAWFVVHIDRHPAEIWNILWEKGKANWIQMCGTSVFKTMWWWSIWIFEHACRANRLTLLIYNSKAKVQMFISWHVQLHSLRSKLASL